MTTPAHAASQPAEGAEGPKSPVGGGAPARRPSIVSGIARIARPHQWIKNLLVFVAPGAAGVLLHGDVFVHALEAFGVFCVAASGSYFLNDAIDVEADRRHPTKSSRPVASGVVPVGLAVAIGVVLLAGSLVLAAVVAGRDLTVVMSVYAAVNICYSLGLKREPILDLAAVSSGFVLRAIAGGVATRVPLTDWFVIVAAFGSLLIVTGKRSGEQRLLTDAETAHHEVRATLGAYTPSFLQTVRTLSAAVTVTAYCLWAFDRAAHAHPGHDPIWFQLTIVPFVLGLLHVVRDLDAGHGHTPEDLAIHDHRLQLYGLVWVAMFAAGIYG